MPGHSKVKIMVTPFAKAVETALSKILHLSSMHTLFEIIDPMEVGSAVEKIMLAVMITNDMDAADVDHIRQVAVEAACVVLAAQNEYFQKKMQQLDSGLGKPSTYLISAEDGAVSEIENMFNVTPTPRARYGTTGAMSGRFETGYELE